jgi:Uma2 family endonuclease
MSVDDFLARHGDRAGVELVKGVVVEYPMPGLNHGKLCIRIGALIYNHVEAHDLGHVMSNDTFVRTGPETVRGGDVCYWSYERLPRGPVPEGVASAAPDLVVEVKSPSNRWAALFGKVGDYLEAGVRVVVLLDPATATASVYRPDELQQIFHNGDALTLPDVLPGFAVPLERLFA